MYKTLSADVIQRLSDGVFIPVHPSNGDYKAFMAWVAEGNEPLVAPVIPHVPQVISRAQGKAVLQLSGLWDDIVAFVETLEGEELILANIALYDTNEYRRDSPFLNTVAAVLRLSDVYLDELFIQGAALQL